MPRRRFQFSLRALLVVMLAAACFFGGIHFERERRQRADEAANAAYYDSVLELRNAIRRGTYTVDLEDV